MRDEISARRAEQGLAGFVVARHGGAARRETGGHPARVGLFPMDALHHHAVAFQPGLHRGVAEHAKVMLGVARGIHAIAVEELAASVCGAAGRGGWVALEFLDGGIHDRREMVQQPDAGGVGELPGVDVLGQGEEDGAVLGCGVAAHGVSGCFFGGNEAWGRRGDDVTGVAGFEDIRGVAPTGIRVIIARAVVPAKGPHGMGFVGVATTTGRLALNVPVVASATGWKCLTHPVARATTGWRRLMRPVVAATTG